VGISTAAPTGTSASTDGAPRVSVVIPCLDEADTIEACVRRAAAVLEREGLAGEVIVVDNGSRDGSAELAARAGGRVLHEPRRGYGSACRAGLRAARGDYVVLLDGDLTYDFAEIPRFVGELESGADVVIGDRMDNLDPGAMRPLHRYVGNPLLSGLLNRLFHTGVRDAHCGMRAVRRRVLSALDLRTTGMEFASEMVIRASKAKLDVRQLPIAYHVRGGTSKLATFSDGWRHLRFLVVHAPTHLFVIPGLILAAFGALIILTVMARLEVLGRPWELHMLVAGSLLLVVGVQALAMGMCAHAYAMYFMGERSGWFARAHARARLEHGLLAGGAVLAVGLVLCALIVGTWVQRGFGRLSEERLAVLAATLVMVGLQVVFSSFLLSILALRRADEPPAPVQSPGDEAASIQP
jgi:hypothetical protein